MTPPAPALPLAAPDAYAELTQRECDVLELVAEGWSNQAVADALFVTVRTVESHVWSILVKFGIAADDRLNRRVVLARLWLLRPANAGRHGGAALLAA